MRVLVLGAAGQLGQDLLRHLGATGHQALGLNRSGLDVSDRAAVQQVVSNCGCAAVVNCAAYTKVDQAEKEPALAYAVNRDGAANVAQACLRAGIPLCQLSTDFVFGQEAPAPARPWSESEEPWPLGVYAQSKRAGELSCLESGVHLFLVRTSWLYGGRGPNFPLSICRAARQGRQLRVVDDQVGSPTFTSDLAGALVQLLSTGAWGTYHLTGSGATTWFEFAKAVLAETGIRAQVSPVSSALWGAPAPRPRYSVLANDRWKALGLPPLPAWPDALRRYVASERQGAFAETLEGEGL
ncbi:MAG: dTDP-4-dehydrorhamnose reductase [Candidatus Dormibacteria bacterium]